MYTAQEVLEFVRENDVKFIRLAFCDSFGTQKNISIMPAELEHAFQNGISFDSSIIPGFYNEEKSDLFLAPELSTLTILPWRPQQGRVIRFFCDIYYPDGRPFACDGRSILKRAVEKVRTAGYTPQVGFECEFYLFEQDEKGRPTRIPFDCAGYLDIAPLDKGENVRREIGLTLEQMGIKVFSSHHEAGPGQNEIVLKYEGALTAADNLITFKSVVKTVAERNGLFASFMPKPILDKSGNGLHINLSLAKNGVNIFKAGDEHSSDAESFIAGILDRIREITAVTNPLTNSYRRFGSFEAPRYVSWSHQNRSLLIRIPATVGQEYIRMELRSPDPACNPYTALALLLYSGMEGIELNKKLPPPLTENLTALPENLEQALSILESSEFVKSILDQKYLEPYVQLKRREYLQYEASKDKHDFEHDMYFRYM